MCPLTELVTICYRLPIVNSEIPIFLLTIIHKVRSENSQSSHKAITKLSLSYSLSYSLSSEHPSVVRTCRKFRHVDALSTHDGTYDGTHDSAHDDTPHDTPQNLLFFTYILTKTCQFCCKINKFRTFLLIYLYMSNFFRTFAVGFLVRTHMHIRTYKSTNANNHTNNGKIYQHRQCGV